MIYFRGTVPGWAFISSVALFLLGLSANGELINKPVETLLDT
jgi:hypothetical protein